MDNPFWKYSCDVYAKGEVAMICLALQDDFGMDVNMILYGAWIGEQGVGLSQEHVCGVDKQVAQWRAEVLLPLRALRRELKDLAASAGSGSYEELKALELDAEEQQQQLMYTYYLSQAGADSGLEVSSKLEANSRLEASAHRRLANIRLVAQFYSDEEPRWNDIVLRLSHYLTA